MIKRPPFAPRRREGVAEPAPATVPPREQSSSRQPNHPSSQPPVVYSRGQAQPQRPAHEQAAARPAGDEPNPQNDQRSAVERARSEDGGEIRDQRGSALTPVNDPNVHVATMGGRQVAALRKRVREHDTIVECIVLPSGALRVTPTSVGPFEFAEDDHAEAFINEVLTSLSVLGCHITRGGERRASEPPPEAEAQQAS